MFCTPLTAVINFESRYFFFFWIVFISDKTGHATIIQQGTMGRVKKGGEVLLPAFLCGQNFIDREREVWVRGNVVREAAGVFTIKQIINFKTLYNMKIETCI